MNISLKSTLIKTTIVALSLSTFLTGNAHANDPDLSVTPSIAYFPLVTLGSTSGGLAFEVRNTHVSNTLNISSVSLQGTHASEFDIDTDACGSQSIGPDVSCFIYVTYSPTSFGSKMARLEVDTDAVNTPTLVAFLSNDEGDQNQAERRLPPVAFSLSVPEIMSSTGTHTLEWSMLGYHEGYDSVVAIFDCDGVAPGQCGLNFGDNIANSGLIVADNTTPQPAWTFNGISATEHHFSYDFQPNLHYTKSAGTYPIVVRFYRKNKMDLMSMESSLSLMIPGNLSDNYYDNEGRRIEKSVTFP